MIGERLVNGRYERFGLVVEADGSIRGYSPVLDLYFTWEPQESGDGLVCVYDPATGERLEPYSDVKAGRRAAEARAVAAEAEAEQLREELRRLRGE